MGDILLDGPGIGVTPSGDIAIVNGDNEILQTAVCNILTIYGEMENDRTRGNMVMKKRIKMSQSGLRTVEDLSRVAILQDTMNISDVLYIKATKSDTTYGMCNIEFSVRTKSGRVLDSRTELNLVGGRL